MNRRFVPRCERSAIPAAPLVLAGVLLASAANVSSISQVLAAATVTDAPTAGVEVATASRASDGKIWDAADYHEMTTHTVRAAEY
jgi:hypothetical protein